MIFNRHGSPHYSPRSTARSSVKSDQEEVEPDRMKPLYSPSPKTSKTELCARIDELQTENDKLREMLHSWREWYEKHYKAHVLYLDDKIKTLSNPERLDKAEISPIKRAPSPPAAPPLPLLSDDLEARREMEKYYAERKREKYYNDTTMKGSRREKQFEEFLQRQTTSAYRSAREAALENRKHVDAMNPNNTAGLGQQGKQFRKNLIRRYGSIRKGWNEALDPLGQGKLGFTEFCSAVRTMGFDSNMKALWEELCAAAATVKSQAMHNQTQNGFGNMSQPPKVTANQIHHVGLSEVDPKGAKATKDLKFFMIDTYGSILRAWNQFVDPHNTDKVKINDFVAAVTSFSAFPEQEAKKVWSHVNTNGLEELGASSGYITLKDFCEESAIAKAKGLQDSFATIETPKKGRPLGGSVSPAMSPMRMTGGSSVLGGGGGSTTRGSGGFFQSSPSKSGMQSPQTLTQSSWPTLVPPPLPDSTQTDYAHLPDPNYNPCKVTQSFLGTLRRKYKSVRDAWYKALDPKGKNMLTFDEFNENCKTRLRYYGNVDRVFKTLDYQNSGMVSMSDLNPRAHECLRDIQFQLVQRFGNILDAFHPFHIGTSNELDLESFARMLQPFQFKDFDVKNVFEWMDLLDKKRIRGQAVEFAKVGAPSKLTRYARHSAERNQDDVHMRWSTEQDFPPPGENPVNEETGEPLHDPSLLKVTLKDPLSPSDAERLASDDFQQQDTSVPEPQLITKRRGAASPPNGSPRPASGGSGAGAQSDKKSTGSTQGEGAASKKNGGSAKSSPKSKSASPKSSPKSSPKGSPAEPRSGATSPARPASSASQHRPTADQNGERMPTPPTGEVVAAGEMNSGDVVAPGSEDTGAPSGSEPGVIVVPAHKKVEFGKKPYPPTYTPECISLLTLCTERYGSLKAAWAEALAPNGEHEIDFVQFCRGMRKLEYEGNLKNTWDSMGQAEHNMAMQITDLNPEIEALFQQWKQPRMHKLVDGNVTFENAWRDHMGSEHAVGISCYDMIQWLTEDNMMTPTEAETVCEWLDSKGDLSTRNYLTVAELDAGLGRKLILPQ
ncbi:unnamed protein product [Amoebophrya sp. A120]|nr:unnamed protein product [Amoebophrya sp. A120]|eukprot:GSA120T00019363001.1